MRALWKMVALRAELYWLSAISIGGRYFWLFIIAPLPWVLVNWVLASVWNVREIGPLDIQNGIVGVPLAVLGIVLGLRIVAGEIRSRNLEIIYTVPGGCERVWWTKMVASLLILVASGALLAALAWLAITSFPILSLYGSLQAAVFYLLLAMGMSTLFRSEVGGGIAAGAILVLNGMFSSFGSEQFRVSPFFNPYAMSEDAETVIAMTVQNRIGYLLLMAAIIALTFMRTNRREHMLGG